MPIVPRFASARLLPNISSQVPSTRQTNTTKHTTPQNRQRHLRLCHREYNLAVQLAQLQDSCSSKKLFKPAPHHPRTKYSAASTPHRPDPLAMDSKQWKRASLPSPWNTTGSPVAQASLDVLPVAVPAASIPIPDRGHGYATNHKMDPFEVRIRFTGLLQHLNASLTSANKASQYALKYRDMDEDLHSCILEQLEKVF